MLLLLLLLFDGGTIKRYEDNGSVTKHHVQHILPAQTHTQGLGVRGVGAPGHICLRLNATPVLT